MSLIFVVILASADVYAAALRATVDAQPKKGARVCWFDARSFTNPADRFTTFSAVTCAAAGDEVPLPAKGLFNVVVMHSDGYVSPKVLRLHDGELEGSHDIRLVPASVVPFDVELSPGENAAVYVEKTGDVFPLLRGEHGVLVPSGSVVVPFFLRSGVASVGLRQSGKGGFVPVVRPAVTLGVTDAVVGVVAEPASNKGRLRRSDPSLVLRTGASQKATLNKLDAAFAGGEALAFFTAVPKGAAIAVVHGEGWRDDEVQVVNGRAARPIRLAPVPVLTVRWSIPQNLIGAVTEERECASIDGEARKAEKLRAPAITVARCPTDADANESWRINAGVRSGADKCSVVRSISLPADRAAGEEAIADLETGIYLLSLDHSDFPRVHRKYLFDGTDATVELDLKLDRWFGRITRGGKPLHAFVGLGNGAVSDPDTGEYVAYSAPLPEVDPSVSRRFFKDPSPISITLCGDHSELMFVPEETPVPNSRFDIDVLPTELTVAVFDESTGIGIGRAEVSYSVRRRDDTDVTLFEGSAEQTDSDGKTTIVDLPKKREIEVCASHEDFVRACAAKFVMDTDAKEVSISLARTGARRGVVHHPSATAGRIVWVSAAGDEVDSANIKPDGTFTYGRAHAPGELAFVVSPVLPLLAFRQPSLREDEQLEVDYPAVAGSFTVSLSPRARETKGFLGVAIGDAVVPLKLFSEHLRWRGVRPVFLGATTITVPDVAVSAPVSFQFAPMTWAEAQSGGRPVDFFYLPAASGLPRVLPDASGVVVVGE